MRILLLSNKSPWPPKDGGAAATLSMLKGLSAGNVTLTVLAMNTSRHFINIEAIPEELRRKTDLHLVNINTRINFFRLLTNLFFSGKPYNIERFRSAEFEKELVKLLEKKFDIIQLEGLALHHYIPVVRKKTSARIVLRAHNVENLIWSQLAEQEINPFRKLYYKTLAGRIKRLEKKVLTEIDALVPISHKDHKWFKDNGLNKPSVVVMPGIDTKGLSYNHNTRPGSVFSIGALDWRPNIHGLKRFVKEVWPLILKKVPDARFFIAGRNASKHTGIRLTGENISFLGEVKSSNEFIFNKSVMVVPLFSGSGIRMKIIEGMSLGKCIVTTPAGADGLDYNDKKDIFIAGTPDEFAEYTIDLIINEKLRRETGKNAIENVRENYDILASADNLIKFYSGIVA